MQVSRVRDNFKQRKKSTLIKPIAKNQAKGAMSFFVQAGICGRHKIGTASGYTTEFMLQLQQQLTCVIKSSLRQFIVAH